MDISVFRQVATNLSGNGSPNIFGMNSWPSSTVDEDDFGYWDSVSESILLPAGWHDIGVSVRSQDGDFASGTMLEILMGRYALGTPSWSNFIERDSAGIATPKRCLRAAVKFASQDYLAIGVAQNSGTGKDIQLEVQIFN